MDDSQCLGFSTINGYRSEMSAIRFATWNAHSVLNKKGQVESLLHLHNLDILAISETWLPPRCPVWQIAGFFKYRRDRPGQRVGGGGTIYI